MAPNVCVVATGGFIYMSLLCEMIASGGGERLCQLLQKSGIAPSPSKIDIERLRWLF